MSEGVSPSAERVARIAGMQIIAKGRGNPAVVFVHGKACDASDWADQVEVLGEQAAAVACDLPWHGSSCAVDADPSIHAFAAAVRLIDELGFDNIILVGHSMGCRVVLETARRIQNRLSGVVLVDGSRIGGGEPEALTAAMAARLVGDGYRSFMRRFFEGMFTSRVTPRCARRSSSVP